MGSLDVHSVVLRCPKLVLYLEPIRLNPDSIENQHVSKGFDVDLLLSMNLDLMGSGTQRLHRHNSQSFQEHDR